MRVLGSSCFSSLDITFFPCAISLKYLLGPPNTANQDSIPWDCINIILKNTLRELDHLLMHLEEANKIPKEVSEFIICDATKYNAYGNETQTMTKVEATADLKLLKSAMRTVEITWLIYA